MVAVRPQPGKQELFMANPADICIYGGAAGGGKTWALLAEPMRHMDNAGFGAVILRRTFPEIEQEGGMWDEASDLYPQFGAKANQAEMSWTFPSGASISFGHMQHDSDKDKYYGAQIALIEFDQLETFEESQFWYMLGRNRSLCGVPPYVRASCNPRPGWLARLLAWWIDQGTGFAIPERAGVIRWFVRIGKHLEWSDSADELKREYPDSMPKSFSFVPAKVTDNAILMQKDPGYIANLMALLPIDQDRLLRGNWKVLEEGALFKREWFKIIAPADVPKDLRWIRAWDLALTTKQSSDRTASVKVANDAFANLYIADGIAGRWEYPEVKALIATTAKVDGPKVVLVVERVAYQLAAVQELYRMPALIGYSIVGDQPDGDKIARLRPCQSRAANGQVYLVNGAWVNDFLDEICSITADMTHEHDDYGDAWASAQKYLGMPATAQGLHEMVRPLDPYRRAYYGR